MSDVVGASAPETPSGENVGVGNVTGHQKELDRLKAERKAANDEAASYRVKLREKEEAELAAKGQVVELNTALQKERDEQAAKITALEALNSEKEAKLTAIETARKAELLAKLPAEKRAGYEGFGLDVLEQIAKDFAGAVPSGNSQGGERGAGATAVTEKTEYVPQVPFESSNAKTIGMLNKIYAG